MNENKKELTFSATIALEAKLGRRSLIVINPDCSVGMTDIEIIEKAG
ncbi:hypothetical protein NOC27_1010 [Nitrosococcus oceani AFC27]|nr:hypothetical protein NOC27_1010 [Nitrosococcus oceani AFC27]